MSDDISLERVIRFWSNQAQSTRFFRSWNSLHFRFTWFSTFPEYSNNRIKMNSKSQHLENGDQQISMKIGTPTFFGAPITYVKVWFAKYKMADRWCHRTHDQINLSTHWFPESVVLLRKNHHHWKCKRKNVERSFRGVIEHPVVALVLSSFWFVCFRFTVEFLFCFEGACRNRKDCSGL